MFSTFQIYSTLELKCIEENSKDSTHYSELWFKYKFFDYKYNINNFPRKKSSLIIWCEIFVCQVGNNQKLEYNKKY